MAKKASASDIVKLVSSDGEEVELEVGIVLKSVTIEHLILDAGIDHPIPLPNVSGKILKKIADYLVQHAKDPIKDSTPSSENNKDLADKISPEDEEYLKIDQATLFELVLAANYLDIKELLDLTCLKIATMIKGKNPDEIRKTFGILNDFSEEELAQVKKENEWLEER